MADAQEIYRRFLTTPLRLRKKRVPSPTSSPSPATDSDGSPATPQPHTQRTPLPHDDAHAFTTPPPRSAVVKHIEVEQLEVRIEVECRVEDAPPPVVVPDTAVPTPRKAAPKRRTSARTRSSTTVAAAVVPITPPLPQPANAVPGKKQKRVTRAVAMANTNTGGVCVDTPTKAAAPPKRSRKSTRQAPTKTDERKQEPAGTTQGDGSCPVAVQKKTTRIVGVDLASITRNILDDFADIDEAQLDIVPKAKSKKTKRKAPVKQQPAAPRQAKVKRAPASSIKQLTPQQEPIRRSRRLREKPTQPAPIEVQPSITQAGSVTEEANIAVSTSIAESQEAVDEPVAMAIVEPVTLPPLPPPPPVIDVVKLFCKPLLETSSTSGALFALWFNALGYEVEHCPSDEGDMLVEILRNIFAVCIGISRTESMARARVDREIDSDSEDTANDRSNKNIKRKAVRFRHFDLSSLSLKYNQDRSVAGFVEHLIREYVSVVGHVTALWERRHHPLQARMVAHIISVLGDTDRLAERTKEEGVVSSAFRSMSEFEHDEVRASQPFFGDEFAKILSGVLTQPTFMEVVFSSLISSLVRFRVRELFLPYDPSELLDDGDRLQIANYEHQDFGAAIHRALQEVYLFDTLASPILAAIKEHQDPRSDAVKKAVQGLDIDDLVHVERYMLAARFLRLSFSRCILQDRTADEETAQYCERVEQMCALVKRLRFEDEAHFYPLASVEEFVQELERLEPSFVVLEKVLETVGLPHYDAEAPCVECNEIVTRAQQPEAITCCSCSGRFHLSCLGLPLSFAQFSGSYTCPFCYLGRTR